MNMVAQNEHDDGKQQDNGKVGDVSGLTCGERTDDGTER